MTGCRQPGQNKSGFPRELACAQRIRGESAATEHRGLGFAGDRCFCSIPLLAYNSVVRWPRCYAEGPGKRARFYAFYIPRCGFLGFRTRLLWRDFGGLLVTRTETPRDGKPIPLLATPPHCAMSAVTTTCLRSPRLALRAPGKRAFVRAESGQSGAAMGADLGRTIRRVVRRYDE